MESDTLARKSTNMQCQHVAEDAFDSVFFGVNEQEAATVSSLAAGVPYCFLVDQESPETLRFVQQCLLYTAGLTQATSCRTR